MGILEKIFSVKNIVNDNVKRKEVILLGLKLKLGKQVLYENIIEEKFNDLKREIQAARDLILVQTSNSFSIYNQHQNVFPKYKNINQGKDIVLIATGPSLKDFKLIENAIYVGVNKAFKYDKAKFDYLFLSDYSGQTKNYIDEFVNYNSPYTKKFIGFLNEDLEPNCIIPDKYSQYPNVERYYSIHPTLKNNFTFDISTQPLYGPYSIAFSAMQFILWTNPRRIYLVGCDCNMSGYYDSADKNNLAVDEVINGWKRMKDFANMYYPDTEIISINPVGLKGIFKDKTFDENNNICDLVSISNDYYTEIYKEIHNNDSSYGAASDHLKSLQIIIEYLKPKTVLDYGCGKGVLSNKLQKLYPDIIFYQYDPSIPGKDFIPITNVDLVINIDVLEHIPEGMIPNVLEKIAQLSSHAFFALHHAKAKAILPNGENAHITIKPKTWYKNILSKYFNKINQYDCKYEFKSVALTFDIPAEINEKFIKEIKCE